MFARLKRAPNSVRTQLAAIPGVDKVETMLVYSEVKPDSGWPVALDDDEG